jgi:hypothetical protein
LPPMLGIVDETSGHIGGAGAPRRADGRRARWGDARVRHSRLISRAENARGSFAWARLLKRRKGRSVRGALIYRGASLGGRDLCMDYARTLALGAVRLAQETGNERGPPDNGKVAEAWRGYDRYPPLSRYSSATFPA